MANMAGRDVETKSIRSRRCQHADAPIKKNRWPSASSLDYFELADYKPYNLVSGVRMRWPCNVPDNHPAP